MIPITGWEIDASHLVSGEGRASPVSGLCAGRAKHVSSGLQNCGPFWDGSSYGLGLRVLGFPLCGCVSGCFRALDDSG